MTTFKNLQQTILQFFDFFFENTKQHITGLSVFLVTSKYNEKRSFGSDNPRLPPTHGILMHVTVYFKF
jgi:hypothetical protein